LTSPGDFLDDWSIASVLLRRIYPEEGKAFLIVDKAGQNADGTQAKQKIDIVLNLENDVDVKRAKQLMAEIRNLSHLHQIETYGSRAASLGTLAIRPGVDISPSGDVSHTDISFKAKLWIESNFTTRNIYSAKGDNITIESEPRVRATYTEEIAVAELLMENFYGLPNPHDRVMGATAKTFALDFRGIAAFDFDLKPLQLFNHLSQLDLGTTLIRMDRSISLPALELLICGGVNDLTYLNRFKALRRLGLPSWHVDQYRATLPHLIVMSLTEARQHFGTFEIAFSPSKPVTEIKPTMNVDDVAFIRNILKQNLEDFCFTPAADGGYYLDLHDISTYAFTHIMSLESIPTAGTPL